MTGTNRNLASARWWGWLISVAVHGLIAGIIALAARSAVPTPNSPGFVDTRAPDHEVTIIVWDDPIRVVPAEIKPILVASPATNSSSDPAALLQPIETTPPSLLPPVAAAAPPAWPQFDPAVKPASHNPPQPEPISALGPGPAANAGQSRVGGAGGAASLLPVSAKAKSVVFVLDRSASMGIDDRIAIARREILATLRQMPQSTRFQVVAYNGGNELLMRAGQREMVPLTPQTLADLSKLLEDLTPEGGNDHLPALQYALWMQPEVVCLLTDADDLTTQMVSQISLLNGDKSIIHAVTIGSAPRLAMQTLAARNRGMCRAIDR